MLTETVVKTLPYQPDIILWIQKAHSFQKLCLEFNI